MTSIFIRKQSLLLLILMMPKPGMPARVSAHKMIAIGSESYLEKFSSDDTTNENSTLYLNFSEVTLAHSDDSNFAGMEDSGNLSPEIEFSRRNQSLPEGTVLVVHQHTLELLKQVGSGAFGEVHFGLYEDGNEKVEVAVKIEPDAADTNMQTLQKEAPITEQLQYGIGFPRFFAYDHQQDRQLMVIQRLGGTLEDFFRKDATLSVLSNLAIQMIARLKYMHDKGYVHRDVKEANFMMGTGTESDRLYIIDFGISARWQTVDGVHVPDEKMKYFSGTLRYLSLNVHKGHPPSRRDDMISAIYLLIRLYTGSLPWEHVYGDAMARQMEIKKKKREMHKSPLTLVQGLPEAAQQIFVDAYTSCAGLEYDAEPDYALLTQMFTELQMHCK